MSPLSGRPLHVLEVLVPGVQVRPQLEDDQLLLSHQLSLPPDHLHTRLRGPQNVKDKPQNFGICYLCSLSGDFICLLNLRIKNLFVGLMYIRRNRIIKILIFVAFLVA